MVFFNDKISCFDELQRRITDNSLTLETFKIITRRDNCKWRIVKTQSKTDPTIWYNHVITRNYDPNRVNAKVDMNNMVIEVTLG